MNKTQKQLIEMINLAIHGRKINFDENEIVNWDELLEEARQHSVTSLIYSSINRSSIIKSLDKESLGSLKKQVFYSGINQVRHIKQTADILKELREESIEVIVLKGLVVRYLYPNPDLRTMSDADIIVHKDDLEKISEILVKMNYKQTKHEDEHGAHIVFNKENSCIEVHWTLLNEDFFKGDRSFEDSLWDNAMTVKVGEAEALSLSWEDLAVHLCVHMASHFSHKGFGVRQLCDLVLVVEKKGKEIDWILFNEKIKKCKLEKFTAAIFNACKKLFNMEIPKELNSIYDINEKTINLVIDDIFEAGVFGNKNTDNMFGRELAFDKDTESGSSNIRIIGRFMRLLFPPPNEMNNKYNYAKKYKILVPIAWIHHLIEGLFNKNYNTKNKVGMLLSTISVSTNRSKLLKKLEL